MARDPVCGMAVDEKKDTLQTQFAGKKYFFCSEKCQRLFEQHPEEYAKPAAA